MAVAAEVRWNEATCNAFFFQNVYIRITRLESASKDAKQFVAIFDQNHLTLIRRNFKILTGHLISLDLKIMQ